MDKVAKIIKGGKKKTYSPPILTAYGTVQEITRKNTMAGKPDGQRDHGMGSKRTAM